MLNNKNFQVSESQIHGSQSQSHTRMKVWVYDPETFYSKEIFKLEYIHFVGLWVAAEFSNIGCYRKRRNNQIRKVPCK